jgi:transposase
VSSTHDSLPDDIEALKAALLAERAARRESEARAAGAEAMVAHLKLLIAKLKREQYGASSERSRKLLDQLEMQLEDLETAAAEAEAAIEPALDDGTAVRPFTRVKPVRGPLPAHLPRERVVVPAPTACPCCGGKLAKLGETVTETLESIPRSYKVIQTVREKFSCRSCEKITQPPAPFHPIARGRAGPDLLATIMHAKFGEHLPLNRQSERFAAEGIDLSVSTLADWVGACTNALSPLVALIEAHVLAAERLHGDDTTVPVLAKDKTVLARLWTYVRDDRPFGGPSPPAAIFYYSRDRRGEHPRRHLRSYAGILQADAYDGFNDLYLPGRKPGPITEAACWAHGRRKAVRAGRCGQGTTGGRGGAANRRDLRHRARHQRAECRTSAGSAAGTGGAAGCFAGTVDAERTGEAVASQRHRQSDGLYAEAMEGVHLLPRRRAHLPDEQLRRAEPPWCGPWQESVALRRQRSRW